jgi:hypothetical protein
MAEGKIYGALIECMRDIGAVGKNKTNEGQHYKFRGIDDIYQAAHPVFARHGVLCLPEVLEVVREERQSRQGGLLIWTQMRVRHRFVADDGSSVEAVTAGEGMDSGDKSSNKAMSAALKYAILETLMIPVDEPLDSEYENPQPQPKAPKAAPAPAPTPAPIRTQDDQIRDLNNSVNGEALRRFMQSKGCITEVQSLGDMTDAQKKALLKRVDEIIWQANHPEAAK